MLRQLLTVVALGSAASAVFAAEQDCFQARDHQLRIQGCSQIIQRDPNDATAYHNRAFARGLAGDIDNAISDYSKVIEIAPENASAYVNRGRAYASKGEYTHAVADQTRAQELIAKATAQPTVAPPQPTGCSRAADWRATASRRAQRRSPRRQRKRWLREKHPRFRRRKRQSRRPAVTSSKNHPPAAGGRGCGAIMPVQTRPQANTPSPELAPTDPIDGRSSPPAARQRANAAPHRSPRSDPANSRQHGWVGANATCGCAFQAPRFALPMISSSSRLVLT